MKLETKIDAAARLANPAPLTVEEVRTLMEYSGTIQHAVPRMQMDLAIRQIEAIDRFNESSESLARGKRRLPKGRIPPAAEPNS